MERQGQPSWDWADANAKITEPHDIVLAARSIIAARRVLTARMPVGFVGEPALVILLDLFVAREGGRTRTLADLAAETDLLPMTAARWCKALEQKQLVRIGLAVDLTDVGVDLVVDTVTAVIESQARLLGMPSRG